MKISLFFLFSIAFTAFGQSIPSIDCNKTLDNEPVFMHVGAMELKDSIQTDLTILAECGQLDTLDRTILNDMLGIIAIRMMQEEKEITYRILLQEINVFKQTEEYDRLRKKAMSGSSDANPELK